MPSKISWYFGRALFYSAIMLCSLAPLSSVAAKKPFKVIYSFAGGSDGSGPASGLIIDKANNLYGTTASLDQDCKNGITCGTVFRMTPSGQETVLYRFSGGIDGGQPYGTLIRDQAGNLIGTTETGGDLSCSAPIGCGTVFKLTPQGAETVLYAFKAGADGAFPLAGVIADQNGNLYGTTSSGGGGNCGGSSFGTVFRLNADGTENILHAFIGGSDGNTPSSGVVMDNAGNLYGTTYEGGTGCNEGCGLVFRISPDGNESVLYRFQGGADGLNPEGGLTIDGKGDLYGTTEAGGAFRNGTVFKQDSNETKSTLYAFQGGSDGSGPEANLLEDQSGNFFGTTVAGGNGYGTIFELSSDGTETVLVSLKPKNGTIPVAGLVEDQAGKHFYGTALRGGHCGRKCSNGTAFEVTP